MKNKNYTRGKILLSIPIVVFAITVAFALYFPETAVAQAGRPTTVRGLKVIDSGAHNVTISWAKARRAQKYIVYIKRSGRYKYRKLATTRKRRLLVRHLKSQSTYYFKVRAVGGKFQGRSSNPLKVRTRPERKRPYGVFIGVNPNRSHIMKNYKLVVIDAENYSKTQVDRLKKQGNVVYSYLNIGSLERFRSYYNKYKHITLGKYDNWPGEYWVDVSDRGWKQNVVKLAKNLKAKEVDGFFIDNCDVYSEYPNKKYITDFAQL